MKVLQLPIENFSFFLFPFFILMSLVHNLFKAHILKSFFFFDDKA